MSEAWFSRPADQPPSSRYDGGSRAILVLFGAVACLLIVERLRRAAFVAPLDYNEGWNAYFALRFAETGSPYQASGELVTNNYPPLWFALVALVGKFTPSMVAAGRLLSTAGLLLLLGSAAGIGRCLRGTWGGIAALVAVAFVMGTQANEWVAVADPQQFAQGVSAFGVFLAVRAREPSTVGYQTAVLAAIFAGFIKHNLAAVPAALLVTALLDSRRAFVKTVTTAFLGLAAGYLICALVGGAGWPRHLISPRTYAFGRLVNTTIPYLTANAFGFVLALAGVLTLPPGHRRRLLTGFVLLSLPIAIFFSGGGGVAVNIFFDSLIAIALGASLVVGTSFGTGSGETGGGNPTQSRQLRPWLSTAAVACWLGAAGLFMFRDVAHNLNHFPLEARVATYRADIEFLRSIKGNAICGQPALCYLAGKPYVYDTYNIEEALLTGALTPSQVLERLHQADIQAIVTNPAPDNVWGIPSPMREEVGTAFEIVRTTGLNVFHVRRVPPPAP